MCHKIISLDYIRDMASGDEKFIVDMIDLFLKQVNEVSSGLSAAIEKNEIKQFFEIIHKLKSSANLFQIVEAVDLIVSFEEQKNLNLPSEKYNDFKNKLEEILSASVIELLAEKEILIKKGI